MILTEDLGTEKCCAKSSINAWLAFPARAGAWTEAEYSPSPVFFTSSLLACGLTVTQIFNAMNLSRKQGGALRAKNAKKAPFSARGLIDPMSQRNQVAITIHQAHHLFPFLGCAQSGQRLLLTHSKSRQQMAL